MRGCRPHSQLARDIRSEEHTSDLQSQSNLVCRLLLEIQNGLSNSLIGYPAGNRDNNWNRNQRDNGSSNPSLSAASYQVPLSSLQAPHPAVTQSNICTA